MTTNYTRGAEFERRIKRHLETNGYTVVRSAGSHSIVDLIALKPGQTLMIQCKITPRLSPADRQQLSELAATLNITPLLATKDTRGHIVYRHVNATHCREPFEIDYA